MRLIDSHCHLDDDRLDACREDVVAAALDAGVDRLVIPGTTANRWEKIKSLCDARPGFYPAYGLHPWFVEQHQLAHLRELDEWLEREPVIALGECGLDFYQSRRDQDWQKQLFREQIQLAENHRLPLILHSRKALDDIIALLRRQSHRGGVLHGFSGSLQQAQQLFDLGFKIGIGANVGFERAQKLRAVVAAMPDEALMLESDAPDQPGPNHRGELNQPAFISETLQVMAELRETGVEDLAAIVNRNAETLFNL